ncbi:MAG: site-specific integrase [Candidatus Diapherotrites archaeon]|nr:site-specific integrase [Candidatus Diapherotrites archaeon]
MVFGKKEQFELKAKELKSCISNKHNLEQIFSHDADLAMKSHSFSGRLQYLTILKELALFKNKKFESFVERDLKDFFGQLKPKGVYAEKRKELSPKTRWIYMCIVKSFFKWLYNAEDDSVPDVVKWIKRKKYVGHVRKLLPSEILSGDEILELVDSAPYTRDRAFIFALFESGCRVASEFLKLKIKDLRANGRYACFDVKGNLKTSHSERTCYLIRSWPEVRNWLNVHPFRSNPDAALWVSLKGGSFGEQLSLYGASHILRRAKVNSKLKKKVFPHLLRHSRALECAKKGYNNQVMNKMFGWSDGSDMAGWYISLAQSDVEEVVLEKEGLASEIKPDRAIKKLDLLKCPKCSLEWSAGTKFCTCGFILDELEAQKVDVERGDKALNLMHALAENFKELEKRGFDLKQFSEFMQAWNKENQKH